MASNPDQSIPAQVAMIIYVVLPIFYWGAEWLTAQSYSPSYSYLDNYTSDLGIPYAYINETTGKEVFSASAYLINLMFVINGTHFLLAQICFLGAPENKSGSVLKLPRTAVAGLYCIGIILVAGVPGGPEQIENGSVVWHGVGALLAIAGGNVNSLLAGMTAPNDRLLYKCCCLALGSAGLSAFIIFLSRNNDQGFNKGLWQRAAIYPTLAWQLLTAVYLQAESSLEPEKPKQQ